MTRADIDLSGRCALVTGAGRGAGRGIAEVLAEQGAFVLVNDLHADRAELVAGEIVDQGGQAKALPFDVTDFSAVERSVGWASTIAGPVDILVNNAGVPENRHTGLFASSSTADWHAEIDLNLFGGMNAMRIVLPGMCERGWGRVVQISSTMAARGVPHGRALYGASKAAVEGLIRHVALEVATTGVTVNALSLGHMASAVEYADQETIARMRAQTPMNRGAEPWEAGAAVAWLASGGAAFVTGQVIYLNGGSYQSR